ncbi:MAG: hypothetical protein QOJ19_3947 [Acidimicrobiia bacterium]|jgi:hypothetical protein|nr:hypothetical protein [Acidimicrobiia bacterium]
MHDTISSPSSSGRGPSALRRLSPGQWKLIGAAAVVLVVVVVVVGVLIGRPGKKATQQNVRDRLSQVVADARHEADAGNGQIDVNKLYKTLDKERSGWIVDLATTTPDRRAVGVAARQPDGTTCIFMWSVVGGSKTATVTDPALPCVAQIALVAAG